MSACAEILHGVLILHVNDERPELGRVVEEPMQHGSGPRSLVRQRTFFRELGAVDRQEYRALYGETHGNGKRNRPQRGNVRTIAPWLFDPISPVPAAPGGLYEQMYSAYSAV